MGLFGDIRQVDVGGEGPNEGLKLLHVKVTENAVECVIAPGGRSTERTRRRPDGLDEIKEFAPFLSHE
jgi:hypothetical protein